jgi:hypothetical protein
MEPQARFGTAGKFQYCLGVRRKGALAVADEPRLDEALDKIRPWMARMEAVGSNKTHECGGAPRHVVGPWMMVDCIKRCLDKDIGI